MNQHAAGSARAALRATLLLAHLGLGLLLALFASLDRRHRLDRARLASLWQRGLLRILGIRVQCRGRPPATAHLSVANHVSWLDICVISAIDPVHFVAKAEIRHWPLAGWLASAAGSVYLRRGHGEAALLAKHLTALLRRGHSIALFPEGTTHAGGGVRHFHARMFAAAIDAGSVVQPIALRYHEIDGRAIAPFVDDDDLLRHLLRVLRVAHLDVDVICCAPIDTVGHERNTLAGAAQATIEHALASSQPALVTAPMPATMHA